MQWIAEVVTLSQALSQYGHPVQWWMTAEPKVLCPFFLLGDSTPLICHIFPYLHPIIESVCNIKLEHPQHPVILPLSFKIKILQSKLNFSHFLPHLLQHF